MQVCVTQKNVFVHEEHGRSAEQPFTSRSLVCTLYKHNTREKHRVIADGIREWSVALVTLEAAFFVVGAILAEHPHIDALRRVDTAAAIVAQHLRTHR